MYRHLSQICGLLCPVVLAITTLVGCAESPEESGVLTKRTSQALNGPPADLHLERDYIFPPPHLLEGGGVAQADEEVCFDCGDVVDYYAFNGRQYSLRQFKGQHVELLLPDSWLGDGGLSDAERRELLDRSDIVYELFREFVGAEPPGPTRVSIAVVEESCGWGCGYVGYKGVEMLDAAWNLEIVKNELAAGMGTNGVILHELAHNFDLFHASHAYTDDAAHAWTAFIDGYLKVYGRIGALGYGPDEFERFLIRERYLPYFNEHSADWWRCVRDAACMDRNIRGHVSWGGNTLRVAQLYGPEAMIRGMSFLRERLATFPFLPTPEAMEDLHIEALAYGAQRNLSCYADAARWQASSELRARMLELYGPDNSDCIDADGDGFSRAEFDCDDQDPSRHPNAIERANGVDDDCNGVIDDVLVVEPSDGDFDEVVMNFPGQVRARLTEWDADFYSFELPSERAVQITLSSVDGFSGWLFVYHEDGSWFDYQYVGLNDSSTKVYQLNRPGTWRIGVELNINSTPGSYSVAIRDVPRWPLPEWATTAEPIQEGGHYLLRADTATLERDVVSRPPTHVRFWATGVGLVGTVPYAELATFSWSPPAELVGGLYGYRAQLLSGGIPVSDFTEPRWFVIGDSCIDNDGDGYGNPASAACAFAELDCDDFNAAINPGAQENCNNGIDDNCNGLVDEADPICSLPYAAGFDSHSTSTATVWFSPRGFWAQYVIAHHTVNDGPQQNHHMGLAGQRWEKRVKGLRNGDRIRYWFTYNRDGVQHESQRFEQWHIGAQPDSLQTLNRVNEHAVEFQFNPLTFWPAYVIVHHSVNGGAQLNEFLSYDWNRNLWGRTRGGMVKGDHVRYSFTYAREGRQYDTEWYETVL